MPLSLDDPAALDPAATGAKAAWLARARQAGLPVLPGVVVPAAESEPFLSRGLAELAPHGSGRSRMAITATPLPPALQEDVAAAAAALPAPLVVRSSSALEGSGVWSGAFTSYLAVGHGELPKAIVGCYAAVFTQAAVERFAAAEVAPTAAAMAVLIQPALEPDCGGTARFVGDDVVVVGVKGSPVPLVQGWDPGVQARVSPGGAVSGDAAAAALGAETIRRVAAVLQRAQATVGANTCEWAARGDDVWLFQVARHVDAAAPEGIAAPAELRTAAGSALGRLVRRYPGPLGESLVLPWAVADPSLADLAIVTPADVGAPDALRAAGEQAAALTAEVWGRPKPEAGRLAAALLRELRGTDPGPALATVAGLRPPDRDRAAAILELLATVRVSLAAAGAVAHEASAWHVSAADARAWLGSGAQLPTAMTRIGFDRWEPFNAAIVAAHGASVAGTAAAAGVAFGRMCVVTDPGKAAHFRPRDIVVGIHPVPGLAALLFDAAALITTGGGPAAHLFESARALGIPALCATRIEDLVGADLATAGEWALAVDGTAGTVHGVEW